MLGHYIINTKGEIEGVDSLTWARWFEAADLHVGDTYLGARVSTVFLGLDHNFIGEGPPILFETMIFEGEHDGEQWRYATMADAVMGHAEACALVRGSPLTEAEREKIAAAFRDIGKPQEIAP